MTLTIDEDRLDETFGALANSTRRAILARLADGAASVNELAEPFAMTLPAISKHIKVLERAGLVVRAQSAQYRPCALDAATIPVAKMDVRVGGSRLVGMEMETPNGAMQMWFTGEYREVVAPRRLVYTESMSDEHGNVLSASDMGMPDGHPTTTEIIVELEDLGGRTKMTMTHLGIPEGSPGAAGWNMAFEKLVAYVEARRIS